MEDAYYTQPKKRVKIYFEDSYGCSSIFEKSTNIKQKTIGDYNILEPESAVSNPNIFLIDYEYINKNKIDYIILVFDLDKPNLPYCNNDIMLDYETIIKIFEKRCTEHNGINITDPTKDNYMGDNVLLIPNFFCSETLYMFIPKLYDILEVISLDDFIPCSKILNNYYFRECALSYYPIKNSNPGIGVYTKRIQAYYRGMTSELITKYLMNNGTKIDVSLKRAIKKKQTSEIMKTLSHDNDLVYKELVNCMSTCSVFNVALSELFSLSDDSSITKFITKYKFSNYNATLRELITTYNQMLLWDPSTNIEFQNESWFKTYVQHVNNTFSPDNAQLYIKSLADICLYHTK